MNNVTPTDAQGICAGPRASDPTVSEPVASMSKVLGLVFGHACGSRGLLFFWNISNQRLGGQDHRGDAGCVL